MHGKALLLATERNSGLRLARILMDAGLEPAAADWYDFNPRGFSRARRPRLLLANCDHPHAPPFAEFAARVRKYWGENFPIIALSSSRKFGRVAGLVDAGANDCLPPDAPEELAKRKIAACLASGERSAATGGTANELAGETPESILDLFLDNDRLVPLGDLVSVYAGAAPRSARGRRTAPPDQSWRRVVTADTLDRFHIGRPTTYLLWNKLHLFRMPAPGEYSVAEKVVLSRVGPPLVAAVDRSGSPVGADAYALVPAPDVCAGFVACLLNSRLLDFYFNRLAGMEGGRLLPDAIKSAPVPRPDRSGNRELGRHATLLAHFGPNPESWIDRQSRGEVRESMDRLVFDLYGAPDRARRELAELHF